MACQVLFITLDKNYTSAIVTCMSQSSPSIVVVGAGIGGLSAALQMAHSGAEVLVLERAPQVGGKMRRVMHAGRAIDAGPTVMTMRWVLEDIFAGSGASLSDFVRLIPVERLARHAWHDGSVLDLFGEMERSADAIGSFAGRREAQGYRDFCAYAQRIFEAVDTPFLRSQRPSLLSMLGAAGKLGLSAMLNIDGLRTLWKSLGDFFRDPRLLQLFARYSTYCGSSPFLAPATLNVIAHVEREGVWMVEGGMYRIAEAMLSLAQRLGVRFRYGEHVEEVLLHNGRASGLRLAGGERISADAVVLNADVGAVAEGRFGKSASRGVPPSTERSLSAMTWAMVAQTEGFPLIRHSIFFSKDYEGEFRELFDRKILPTDPTVYICAQDRDDSGLDASFKHAEQGGERLLCLINAPAFGDRPSSLSNAEIEACGTRIFTRLGRSGLKLTPCSDKPVVTTPADFERLFPATGGALYGPASHGWRAAFSRAAARTKTPGLYLSGGSAHPGAGVPMAALSGSIAARSVLSDLASTRRFPTMVTPGGISISSATTNNMR